MPAHITAKIVMASAARLTPVRQRWRNRNRIAEISVPAWPIPIHQTKLTISHPHITGCILPQTPTPVEICQLSMKPNMQRAPKLILNEIHHQSGALPSQIEETRSEIHAKPCPLATRGMRCSSAGGCGTFAGTAGCVAVADIRKQ